MPMLFRWFAAITVFAGAVASASAQDVSTTNCEFGVRGWQEHIELAQQAKPGPFRLTAIHCQKSNTRFTMYFTAVSPDVGSMAVLNGRGHEVFVARLSSPVWDASHSNALVFPDILGARLANSQAARVFMRWSADSQVLWSATQEKPLAPIRGIRMEGGVATELPEMLDPAGRTLDALLWADDGRALAMFGKLRGNGNRTLAFVDAVRGRVIASLPALELYTAAGVHDPEVGFPQHMRAAEIAALRDGRLRAFLSIGPSWVVWTQGQSPRILRNPYRNDDEFATAISADGARVLIVRSNHRVAVSCVGRDGPCGISPPVDGVLGGFFDLLTGRAVWTYRLRTGKPGLPYAPPALSDDGRYALLGPLAFDGNATSHVALIATRDGSPQQLFPVDDSDGGITMGFARGSRRLWINSNQGTHMFTAVYALP